MSSRSSSASPSSDLTINAVYGYIVRVLYITDYNGTIKIDQLLVPKGTKVKTSDNTVTVGEKTFKGIETYYESQLSLVMDFDCWYYGDCRIFDDTPISVTTSFLITGEYINYKYK